MCCLTQLKRWGVTLHMWFDSGTHEVPSRSACPPSLSLPHLQGCFWYQIAYDNCKKHQAFILWGISPAGKRSPLFFFTANQTKQGFPGDLYGKESACNAGDPGLIPRLGRSPGERGWLPTPVFLPGEYHGQRSPVGYSPLGLTGRTWLSN